MILTETMIRELLDEAVLTDDAFLLRTCRDALETGDRGHRLIIARILNEHRPANAEEITA